MTSRMRQRLAACIKHNRCVHFVFYVPIRARRFALSLRARVAERRYQSLVGLLARGTVAVFVGDFGGEFEFDVRSDVLERILLTGEYERDNLVRIDQYLDADRDVIDVGANCGLFSVYFARRISRGRRVLALEPTPRALQLLSANLWSHGVADSVIVYPGVAAAAPGSYSMKVVEGKEEYSTLGNGIDHAHVRERVPQEIRVPGDTVDALVREHALVPGFMKIDAEGAEYLVLQGAQVTLRQHHPVILSELVDDYLARFGHSAQQVVDTLRHSGYVVKDVSTDEAPLFPFNGTILAVSG